MWLKDLIEKFIVFLHNESICVVVSIYLKRSDLYVTDVFNRNKDRHFVMKLEPTLTCLSELFLREIISKLVHQLMKNFYNELLKNK